MNSSFSTKNPLLQVAWDMTSLSAFKECPRKYYYSIIFQWASKDESVHLTFGLLYHAALEYYQRLRAQGKSWDESILLVVHQSMKDTWNKDLNRPWNSGDKNKNRYTLIRTIVWWITQFKDDPMKTLILSNGTPAVELSFRFETTYSLGGQPVVMCGHLDRVGTLNDALLIDDYKTTKYNVTADEFFGFYSPDNQMSGYTFGGKIIYHIPIQGVIVDAAQIMPAYSRFRRGFALRTDSQLDEWYRGMGYFLEQAESMANANFWPMNETACGRYGGCQFRGICGRSPEVREQWLGAGYRKRIWDPLKVRGDV